MKNLMTLDKSNQLSRKKFPMTHPENKNRQSRMTRRMTIIMNRTLLKNENQIIIDIVLKKMQSHLLRKIAQGKINLVDIRNLQDKIEEKIMSQRQLFTTLRNIQMMN